MGRYPFERAYQTVMAYDPDQVKDVLRQEIPKIEETIDQAVDDWGKGFAEMLKKGIDDFADAQTKELGIFTAKIEAIKATLVEGKATAKVEEARTALKTAMDDFKAKWEGM